MLQKWKALNDKQQDNIIVTIFIISMIIGACMFCCLIIKTKNYYKEHPDQRPVHTTTTNTQKNITCTIINISYRHWYASAHHFTADISVKDNESGLEESFHITGLEAQEFEDYHTGNQIQAVLTIQSNTETGKILNQYINNLQP